MEKKTSLIQPGNTFGIQFLIRQDKLKDGKAPIYVRITINGEVVHFALKQRWVDPKSWDNRRGTGKGNRAEILQLNTVLENVRIVLANHYQQMQLKGQYITASAIKDAYLGNADEEPNTLSRLIAYHFEQAKLVLEWSTLKHYSVTERYLKKFIQERKKRDDVFLHEINYRFILDFESFLRAHKPLDHQKPMNNNGVMKHLLRLRKMTSLAIRLEWLQHDPFKNFKIKHEKVEKDFLTASELRTIEKKHFDVERLNIVKDLFVFCCYTGLAFVDVGNLTETNIIEGIDGEDDRRPRSQARTRCAQCWNEQHDYSAREACHASREGYRRSRS